VIQERQTVRYCCSVVLLALVVALVAHPLAAQATGPRALSAAERARVDSVFSEYDRSDAPGCALGVFRDGGIAYARGYGMADLERGVRITPATLFDIGSTSKQFAAASIALLVEEGKLRFDDDVRKYIPELPDYGAPITIDNLLRHTSGLRDYVGLLALAGHSLEEVTTDSQALAIIARQRNLNFPTGSRWEYSNTGFFLLSVIVKRVSGQSLADFARSRIFLPLGMTHTRYRDRAEMLIPGRALGYAPDSADGFVNSMSNWEETGDGAVHLSVEDALLWDENFYHPRVGGERMVKWLQERGTLANGDSIDYARGLFVDSYRGLRRVQHGGDWIGYHAAYARFPEQHTSVITFCNSDGISPDGLADKVADVVLADAFREGKELATARSGGAAGTDNSDASRAAPAATVTGADAGTSGAIAESSMVGNYYVSSNNTVFAVSTGEKGLRLHVFGQDFPLERSGPATMSVTDLPVKVVFTAGATNTPARSARLVIGSEAGNDGMRFTPATPDAATLKAYAGSYYSPELGVTWPIVLENGKLVLKLDPGSLTEIAGELTPAMRDAFTAGGGFLHFKRDNSGRVTGFALSASRMRDIGFERTTGSGL
ncbi:MAG TPA: serine hydrolase, partial [Gemmatimonadaceae bacterium]|nr:serine hydrolase [Gemmatimonadaceae bacterium]